MPSNGQFKFIEAEDRGGVTLVRFRENRLLDEELIRSIADELAKLADGDRPKLLLSFEAVEYLASAMLGKLITVQRRVERKQGKFAFCAIPSDTYEIFKISRLDNYFKIYKTVDEAVAAMQ